MWYQHMLPSMENDLNGSEVMGAALQPIFYMIEDSSEEDFKQILFPLVHQLINIPRSVQVIDLIFLLASNNSFPIEWNLSQMKFLPPLWIDRFYGGVYCWQLTLIQTAMLLRHPGNSYSLGEHGHPSEESNNRSAQERTPSHALQLARFIYTSNTGKIHTSMFPTIVKKWELFKKFNIVSCWFSCREDWWA